jgi:hypothetical protein
MNSHAIAVSRRMQFALGTACLIVVIVLGGAVVLGLDMANYFASTRLVTADPVEGGVNPFRVQDAAATTIASVATVNAAPVASKEDAVPAARLTLAAAQ